MSDIIGAYHRTVADAIGRFDGFVAKYMGDGVLTYFGYPQAHEDDASLVRRTLADQLADHYQPRGDADAHRQALGQL